MKILPREHGATVIWAASILMSLLTLRASPPPMRLAIFLAAAIAILISAGQLTGRSQTLIRIQRNRLFLPILSGSLTLITPLGDAFMFGNISGKSAAVWLLLLTYTVVSVSLIQTKVQGLLREKDAPAKQIVAPGLFILTVEVLLLSSVGLMHLAALFSLTPLAVTWIYLSRGLAGGKKRDRVKVIRRIVFQQTGNMIAFVVILALLTRL